MLKVFLFALVLFSVILIYCKLTQKYVNPYKLIFVFGKKGSGKSTLLTKLAYKYLKKDWKVYTTEKLPGTLNIDDPKRIFDMNFPEKSCIFIDEVSLIWDNRDFKNMDKRTIEWFRYQRHHKCRVYFFSQTFDIDKKLRDLADDMYLVNKYFRVLVIAKHIVRKPVVVHPGPESPARIDDDMVVDGPLLWLFGGRITAFIPYWSKCFDTHKLPGQVNSKPSSQFRN